MIFACQKPNVLSKKPSKQFFLSTENCEKGLIVPYACGLPALCVSVCVNPFLLPSPKKPYISEGKAVDAGEGNQVTHMPEFYRQKMALQ